MPRIKLNQKTGHCVVSIGYRDLRAILTSAALNHYDQKDAKEGDAKQWHESRLKLIGYLEKQLDSQLSAETPKPRDKAQRFRAVREQKSARLAFERFIKELINNK